MSVAKLCLPHVINEILLFGKIVFLMLSHFSYLSIFTDQIPNLVEAAYEISFLTFAFLDFSVLDYYLSLHLSFQFDPCVSFFSNLFE
jgi:hypothetical protein